MIIIIYGSQLVWLTKPKTRLCVLFWIFFVKQEPILFTLVVSMVGQTRVGQTMGKADYG